MSDDASTPMTSSRPYLLRALNDWIVDNGATPQILVDGTHPELSVPDAARAGDKLVLNISPSAVRDLEIDNEFVSFVARFSGVSHGVLVPVSAVQAVYARESGQGMMFPDSDDEETSSTDESNGGEDQRRKDSRRKKPDLRVIK